MTMAERLSSLPPIPDTGDQPWDRIDDPVVLSRIIRGLHARNAVLSDTLGNVCEAWKMLRGEYPHEVDEVIRLCKVA